jgi:hypothetical protein
MAPNTPLALAQFALMDAHRAHDALRLANMEVVQALERADEELTLAEQFHENVDELWQLRANYEDIRIIYDDVFGGAEQDIRIATEALERLRT